ALYFWVKNGVCQRIRSRMRRGKQKFLDEKWNPVIWPLFSKRRKAEMIREIFTPVHARCLLPPCGRRIFLSPFAKHMSAGRNGRFLPPLSWRLKVPANNKIPSRAFSPF